MHAELQHRPGAETSLSPPRIDVRRHALFLDLDGTLVEIAARPELVRADARMVALLRGLSDATDGAIAIITGRTIADADAIVGGALQCVAGLHGLECRRGGEIIIAGDPPLEGLEKAKRELAEIKRAGGADFWIEDKVRAVTVHYRHAPHLAASVRVLVEHIGAAHGLRVVHGKMISELVVGKRTKGDAIADLMQQAPFIGRAPVFAGDDVTDEDAFVAANSMAGVSVLVGEARDTEARYRLGSVSAVHAWLGEALA